MAPFQPKVADNQELEESLASIPSDTSTILHEELPISHITSKLTHNRNLEKNSMPRQQSQKLIETVPKIINVAFAQMSKRNMGEVEVDDTYRAKQFAQEMSIDELDNQLKNINFNGVRS